ncbi:MAG: PQQ-binding-like beta-propeller repeat protein [Deltaproteobacteria bacterium]|nr:PQQ-binding-like beta-propeller repeat protein [Deltaproteobacteria bacterium]
MRVTLLVVPLLAACSADPVLGIASRWQHDTPAKAAPVALGPERRVIVLLSEAASLGGELVTVEEQNGLPVEGPTPGAPLTARAPVVSGTRVFVITTIGKLTRLDFLAQSAFVAPESPLGPTTTPVFAADGSVRFGTTSGRVFGFDADGAPVLDVPVGGAVTSIFVEGTTTYATTDAGRVVGIDESGALEVDVSVDAPAQGIAVSPDGNLYVGEATGLRAFDPIGDELWKRPRAARVVGALLQKDETLLAWGEDGVLERLDQNGNVIFSARSRPDGEANPPAIYAAPLSIEGDRIGAFDASGRALLIGPDGAIEDTLDLGQAPTGDPVIGELGFAFIAVGSSVRAIDFTAEK